MLIKDIEANLPWGFHDAYLERLTVDWTRGTAQLDLRVMMSEHQDLDQLGRLSLLGLAYIAAEPPSKAVGECFEAGLWVDSEEVIAPYGGGTSMQLPVTYFLHRFYVHSTESSIYVCAREATFEWIEDSPSNARAQSRALFPGERVPPK